MAPKIIIYGATGYSGGLIIDEAVSLGLQFIISGRSEDKVKAKAASIGVPYRAFSPDDSNETIDKALDGIAVFVNGAGPYIKTARPFMDACIRNGAHYVDMTAEAITFTTADARDQAAKEAGITLLPGGGGVAEVFMDCLVGHVASRTLNPVQVDQVLDIAGPVSRGTAATIRSFTVESLLKRIDGELVQNDPANSINWDFQDGRGEILSNPSGDPQVYTLWKALRIPNIRTFICKTSGDLPTGPIDTLPDGPTRSERDATPYTAGVAVTGADGTVNRSTITMRNGYTITAEATARAAQMLADGNFKDKTGWQTPLMFFGSEYPLTFPGTTIKDL